MKREDEQVFPNDIGERAPTGGMSKIGQEWNPALRLG